MKGLQTTDYRLPTKFRPAAISVVATSLCGVWRAIRDDGTPNSERRTLNFERKQYQACGRVMFVVATPLCGVWRGNLGHRNGGMLQSGMATAETDNTNGAASRARSYSGNGERQRQCELHNQTERKRNPT
jgi:hypothetical protein